MLITCLPRMKVVSSIPVYVCLDLDLARRPNLTLLGLQASFWLNAYLGMRFSVNNKRWAIMVLINLPIDLTRSYLITRFSHEAALSRSYLIRRFSHKGSSLIPMSYHEKQLLIKIYACSNDDTHLTMSYSSDWPVNQQPLRRVKSVLTLRLQRK